MIVDNIVIFDKLYPKDKQAEGMAINWCLLHGKCHACRDLVRCQVDPDFTPPKYSACMIRKRKILREWEAESEVAQ